MTLATPVLVTVAGLTLDEASKAPVVVLRDEVGGRIVPITIGIMEASSIAAQLEGVAFPRPMTHDLLAAVIKELGGTVERIEVTDIINETFYAMLHIKVGKRQVTMDSRPSDAIALALRTGAVISVAEIVFEKLERSTHPSQEDRDAWKEVLENLDDDDFGKYKM